MVKELLNVDVTSLGSASQIVDVIIREAIELSASDILFEPYEQDVFVRIRMDGILHRFTTIPSNLYDAVVSRIKIMANLDISEHRHLQEGKIQYPYEQRELGLRVALISSASGWEMIAIRIHDLTTFTSFGDLGMSDSMEERLKRSLHSKSGLLLVAGPTGSGKTTTVHTTLRYLNDGSVNIMTVEDPIEYLIPGTNQLQVDEDSGLTFISGLRSILRLSPDIIFVGEIRDRDTARMAVQSALTGHLVLSTVHADESVGVVYRMINLGVDRYLLSYVLQGVIAQRLFRRLCPHCKKEYKPTPEELAIYQKDGGDQLGKFYTSGGCTQCNNIKFKGRIGVFEFLLITKQIRNLINHGAGEEEFRADLTKAGFKSLKKEGLKHVTDKTTSIGEYIRVMFHPT